jgi:hypothetical protein
MTTGALRYKVLVAAHLPDRSTGHSFRHAGKHQRQTGLAENIGHMQEVVMSSGRWWVIVGAQPTTLRHCSTRFLLLAVGLIHHTCAVN